MGLRGSQTEACFCFPYNALGCFCFFLVGYSCDTWPKASCSYKAIIIWCCSYIFWLRCAELLSACSSRLLQGTNWHRVCSGIRSCCFGLSGEAEQTKLCNHPSPVPPMLSIFWVSGDILLPKCPMKEQRTWSGKWSWHLSSAILDAWKIHTVIGENFKMLKKPGPVLHCKNIKVVGGNHSKTKHSWLSHLSHFIPVMMNGILFSYHLPWLFPLPFYLYHLGRVYHCYIYCAAIP